MAADPTATITIVNAGSGATFKYLQVIKADTSKTTGWAFTSTNIAQNYIEAFTEQGETAPTDQEVIQSMIDGGTGVDGKVAAALVKVKNANYSLLPSGENGTKSPLTVNAAGVYYIEGSETDYTYSPMAGYVSFKDYGTNGIPTDLEDATVEAKRATSVVGKSSDQENDVTEINRTVQYTVTSVVPYIAETETNKYYKVIDTINGASYVVEPESSNNKGKVKVHVAIGSGEGAVDTDLFVTASPTTVESKAASTFTLDLTSYLENNKYANKNVTLTYSATVTDTKVGNTVQIGDGTDKGKDRYGSDSENLYTGKIILTKYAFQKDDDEDVTDNTKLKGAGFKIYKDVNNYATFDMFGKFTGWVGTEDQATEMTTDANGTFTVSGLAAGTYTFKEVTAPQGYSISNPKSIQLEIGAKDTDTDGNVTAEFSKEDYVIDTKLSSLPSTGGIGTTIFTIGGCAIMIIAAALFFASRRKSAK